MRATNYEIAGYPLITQGNEDAWTSAESGSWEPGTLRFITSQGVHGRAFVDIGAWIGQTALVAASSGMKVHAFEPDPVAFLALRTNVALNPQIVNLISISNSAFSRKGGTAELYQEGKYGNSKSSLVKPLRGSGVKVDAVDGEAFLSSDTVPTGSIIKIDIEGGEYSLLPAIRKVIVRKKLTLMLSTHPERISPFLAPRKKSWKIVLGGFFNFPRNFVFIPFFVSHVWWEDLHHSTTIRRLRLPILVKRVFSGKNRSFYLIPKA